MINLTLADKAFAEGLADAYTDPMIEGLTLGAIIRTFKAYAEAHYTGRNVDSARMALLDTFDVARRA